MDILRFITAGNIDDGKSTLTGRLLLDSGNIKTDVLQTVTSHDDEVNLAHIADGLRSEREQGITIDIAYKYFVTAGRKFIVTDAPGHFQYTRNLVTGASNADVIIVLIDALNGITGQTKRHSMVAAFLGIRHLLVAINKMDAVNYDKHIFDSIAADYAAIAAKLGLNDITVIPASALKGDNVSFLSGKMKWYTGTTILEYLQQVEPARPVFDELRFIVQYIADSNGKKLVAGRLLSGVLRKGAEVMLWPQRTAAKIVHIFRDLHEAGEALPGQSVNIVLDAADVQRGTTVTQIAATVKCSKSFEAEICWLDDATALEIGNTYVLRVNAQETACTIKEIVSVTDTGSFDQVAPRAPVVANEFATVIISTTDQVVFDPFAILPATGRGILIDVNTNSTLAALTITDAR